MWQCPNESDTRVCVEGTHTVCYQLFPEAMLAAVRLWQPARLPLSPMTVFNVPQ